MRAAQTQCNAFLLYDRPGGLGTISVSPVDRPGAVYIGRADGNDVTTDWEHSVSGTHAKIEREATVWFIENLNSKNGTFVGGERIRRPAQIARREMSSRLRMRDLARRGSSSTASRRSSARRHAVACNPPTLRPSQLKLLSALCVCQLYGEGLEPATDQQMARVLVGSPYSMRSALTPMYVTCGLQDVPYRSRRRRLMEFALAHGLARREHLDASPEEILRRLADDGRPGR